MLAVALMVLRIVWDAQLVLAHGYCLVQTGHEYCTDGHVESKGMFNSRYPSSA